MRSSRTSRPAPRGPRGLALAAALGTALAVASPARVAAQDAPFDTPLGEFFLGPALIGRFHDCTVDYPGVCVAARVEQGIERATGEAAARGFLWVTRNEPFRSGVSLSHDFEIVASENVDAFNAAGAFRFAPFGGVARESGWGRDAVLAPVTSLTFAGRFFFAVPGEGDLPTTESFYQLFNPIYTVSPEPATIALVGGGVLLVGAGARRIRRRANVVT